MRGFSIFLALGCWFSLAAFTINFQGTSPAAFYAAVRTGDPALVEQQLSKIQGDSKSELARKGTLLMKKSNQIKGAGEKIRMFKEGRALLERAIRDADRPEFHFMRLMIQENAPSFLKYDQNINADVQIVTEHFPKLPAHLRSEIRSYALQSKNLKAEQLKDQK